MRKLLAKILEILDGTPAEYGQRQRGQSVVELTLVTPILIVLFASMVEIGWFANNYLTLLDVTRAGARRGTTLQDRLAPLDWDVRASHVPNALLAPAEQPLYAMPDLAGAGEQSWDEVRLNYRQPCITGGRNDDNYVGFYNELACLVQETLDPLELNNDPIPDPDNPGFMREPVDDIVISAVAVEAVPSGFLAAPAVAGLGSDVRQMAVVGRYPINANECESDGAGAVAITERDPFDYDNDNQRAVFELDPLDPGPQQLGLGYEELPGFDPPAGSFTDAEKQIGFSWLGNHVSNEYPGCLGTEWSLNEIEQLVNLPGFLNSSNPADDELQRELLPGQGIVIVEVFWEHRPLLNLPLFTPVFRVFGEGPTTIAVWAMFPLPTVEPFLIFP